MSSNIVRELAIAIRYVLDKGSQRDAERSASNLKSSLDKAGTAGESAGNKISSGMSKAAASVHKVQNEIKKLDTANVGGNMAMGGAVAAGAGTAMLAPLAASVQTVADFDATMSKVQALTGASAEDFKKLRDAAREAGATTKYSATESAEAMTFLGMAGWKTNQIIAGMPGLLDLAAASGTDLATAADIVSDQLTAFHMKADDAGRMADVFAVTSANANTNVQLMGETLKYVGPVAGAAGYSIEDMSVAIGLMGNASIKGSEAGTALRSIITRLAAPPKEAAAAIETLGINVADSAGNMRPFNEVLGDLRKSFAGLSQVEAEEKAKSLAGQEAMSGFLALMTAGQEDVDKLTEAIGNANGKAKEMSDIMMNNFAGRTKEIKSAFEDIMISIGDSFTPMLSLAANGLKYVATEVGKFAKENPGLVSGIASVVGIIGALLAVVGGGGIIFGGLLAAIGSISTAMTALAPFLAPLMAGFAAAAGPVLAVLGAIAVAIYTVKSHWDMLGRFFQPLIDMFEESLADLRQSWLNLQPAIEALMPLLSFIGELLSGVIVAAMYGLLAVASVVFRTIAALVKIVTELIGDLGNIIKTVSSWLGGLIDKAAQYLGMQGSMEAAAANSSNYSSNMSWSSNIGTINVGSVGEAKDAAYTFSTPTFYGRR